jgi:hypothetical protein
MTACGHAFPIRTFPHQTYRGRDGTTRLTKQFPSPSTGEGAGGGEITALLPPIPPFPHYQGGRT